MNYKIPFTEFPDEVEVGSRLTPEEQVKPIDPNEHSDKNSANKIEAAFHEKSAKNSKEKTEKVSYKKILKAKFKKPIRRGDKIQNLKKKNKK